MNKTKKEDRKERFLASALRIVNDCTGVSGIHTDVCQGCVELVIQEPEYIIEFWEAEIEKAERSAFARGELKKNADFNAAVEAGVKRALQK